MQLGNVFSYVCLCVCLSVQAITFEPLPIETSFSVPSTGWKRLIQTRLIQSST